MIRRSSVFAFFTLILAASNQLRGADEPTEKVEEILDSVIDAREQLFSGAVKCDGKLSMEGMQGTVEGNTQIFCAFDDRDDLLRFDRIDPCRRNGEGHNPYDVVECGGKYARSSDRSFHYVLGSNNVKILGRAAPPPAQVRPLDLRSLGILDRPNIRGFRGTLREAVELLKKLKVASITTDGLTRIDWIAGEPGQGSHKLSIWIDTKQGHTPVRLRAWHEAAEGWSEKPFLSSDTTWAERNGVSVPTNVRMEHDNGTRSLFEIELEWSTVCGQINPVIFAAAAFGVADSVPVIDGRANLPAGGKWPLRPR